MNVKTEKSTKTNKGYTVVPAPISEVVPLQLVGAEVTRVLRKLEITAYQSPRLYTEQERKVDMAPAAPIKPGKPVADWDTSSKPAE